MVYLKKKIKKRPSVNQIRHQATKALTKACKLTKTQLIMKLVRNTKKSQGYGCGDVEIAQRLEGLKVFSYVTCGERLTKNVFGEFVPPLEDDVEREIEETISKNKNVIECKNEWITRLKDVHSLMERQNKAAQAKHASELRKQGLVQDVYGGIHEMRQKKKALTEPSDEISSLGRKDKRSREELNVIPSRRCEDKGEKEVVGSWGQEAERRAHSLNWKERRKINHATTKGVFVGGKAKTIIPGPSVQTVHDSTYATEKGVVSSAHNVLNGRSLKATNAIHPSWAAKKKQKEKLFKSIDLGVPSKRKKIKFDDS